MDNGTPLGILRKAVITDTSLINRGFITATIDTGTRTLSVKSQNDRDVQIPFSFYSIEGLFIGGIPSNGTPIIIGRGEGTNWYFVSFLTSNVSQIPSIVSGELLMQTNNLNKISLLDSFINLGSKSINLHLNTSNKKFDNKLQSNFSNHFIFSESEREVSGIVKREVNLDNIPSQLKLIDEVYDNNLIPISFDPSVTTVINSNSANKNPPFVEKRELIYEFAASSNVVDDITESSIYSPDLQSVPNSLNFVYPNRRNSKTDTLSLSLVAPNFLMETIKGTVVDIFGNILDLNRNPIVGYGIDKPNLSLSASNIPKDQVFNDIKSAERRSLAFHFEINARKDLSASNGKLVLPDINSKIDYAKSRSRFFIDIDKEGQVKANFPASSETGNIPLGVRYENYSSFGHEDNGNPNKLIFRDDALDIFSDSFTKGVIDLVGADGKTSVTSIDRISNTHIKFGSIFHDISQSCISFQANSIANYTTSFLGYQTVFSPIDVTKIPTLPYIVSPVITTAGPNANAGGRSGSLHFDGSLNLSVGANTIDRQSLWIDTSGSVIGMFGRDKNNVSAALDFNGDVLVQIGGSGVSDDSRFSTLNNGYRQGNLDIRVMNEGFTTTIIRIDSNGITIMTPSSMTFSARKMVFQAKQISMDADEMALNGRQVLLQPGISI